MKLIFRLKLNVAYWVRGVNIIGNRKLHVQGVEINSVNGVRDIDQIVW